MDIIHNPENHGFGAGIQQTTASAPEPARAKNTVGAVLKTTVDKVTAKAGQQVTDRVAQPTQNASQDVRTGIDELKDVLLGKDGKASSITAIADEFLTKSVDRMLEDQLKKGTISLDPNKLDSTFAGISSVYKKLYDTDKDMLALREDTIKNISSTMNREINNKLTGWLGTGQDWRRQLLSNTKLTGVLQKVVSAETAKCVSAILNNNTLSVFSKSLSESMKRLTANTSSMLQKQLKHVMDVKVKIKEMVTTQIKAFTEAKAKIQEKFTNLISSYKEKIASAISDFTSKLAGSAQSLIASAAGGLLKL